MGKHIIKSTYWLGVVSAVLGLTSRSLNALGIYDLGFGTRGNGIGYHTFLEGAVLFLVISECHGGITISQRPSP